MAIAAESRGSGPPLALIHGVGTDRAIWARAAPILAEAREVTVLDVPGFGESDPLGSGFELEATAEAIAAELRDRIGGPFDLIGSSLGGALALLIATRNPGLVRRLVLSAPAGFRTAPEPLARLAGLAAGRFIDLRRGVGLRLADRAQARRAIFAGTIHDGAALDPEDARLVLRASERAQRTGPAVRAALRADLREELGRLATPLGLIWGSHDRVIPGIAAERILELHPDAPLETIAGAGHIPQLERPREYAAAVERLHSRL